MILLLFLGILFSFEFSHNVAHANEVNKNSFEYVELTDGENVYTLTEGDHVQIPIKDYNESESSEEAADGAVSPFVSFPGNKGVVDLWIQNWNIHYNVKMYIPADKFSGFINVTDISSGLSMGMSSVSGFSGFRIGPRLIGHMYSASLSGTAYRFGVPVAKTVTNKIFWTYK